MHRFLRYWLPVLIWMALVFSASADTKSSHTSSLLIGPLVKFLLPNISEVRLEQIVSAVRKAAHLTEYAVLSWLLARALLRPGTPWGHWDRKAALLAWLIASLYAASDELHQAFVPNRQGRWPDVCLDSFGAALGVVTFYHFGRWRKYW